MAAPSPAGAASAAASPSPPMQLPSPFAELVKGPSGLEKIVLRGARNCCAEVRTRFRPRPPASSDTSRRLSGCVHTTAVCWGASARRRYSFLFWCSWRRSGGNSADPRGVWAELMRFLVFRCAISPVRALSWSDRY